MIVEDRAGSCPNALPILASQRLCSTWRLCKRGDVRSLQELGQPRESNPLVRESWSQDVANSSLPVRPLKELVIYDPLRALGDVRVGLANNVPACLSATSRCR